MRVSILKYVLFSIVICSFEYAKNELYFVNDKEIYLGGNVINFRNNRILAYADNQFDLNEFYESTLSLASQLGDCVEGNKEIAHLRNIIDSHIKKHKGSKTSLDLKNVDSKTKKKINELRKELEEVKKELDNKRNDELAIQPIENKKIIKKDGNSSVSEHEDFKQLKNNENNENNEITSSNRHMKSKLTKKYRKEAIKYILSWLTLVAVSASIPIIGLPSLMILLIPSGLSILFFQWRLIKCNFKLKKIPK
ncbi:cleft-like protein 1 [Plasmodium berghei]|uniref:Cleft-like protein 1 n=4 Tax=Plasmodium berghei TaxID=5821 RepID=A0A509AR86_PLABA|nr:cleft-like protein 1 [Plasmodium berghei ANKA]SCL86533.1 cleft-like protein 1 [Plasmodium berghei]VUC57367.1 cleft-like protein 1 [Plasmodium berghei ANKA]|eukprot:XP_034423145.1 cleft-like protein 1 [Plasmodium berghei ANKA]